MKSIMDRPACGLRTGMLHGMSLFLVMVTVLLVGTGCRDRIQRPLREEGGLPKSHEGEPHVDAGYNAIFDLAQVDTPPRPIWPKRPDAPFEISRGPGDEVVVAFTIDREGITRDIEVVRTSNQDLNGSATEAVAAWRFVPAQHRGEPVNVRMQVPIVFR